MTAKENWFERYIDERIREHEERVRLRELRRAAREAGHLCAVAERVRKRGAGPASRGKETAVWSKDTSGTPLSAQGPRARRAMSKPWRRQHRAENP